MVEVMALANALEPQDPSGSFVLSATVDLGRWGTSRRVMLG